MEMVSLYRDIIKKSLAITKKYKHLWFLGFLAALLGNGGELEFVLAQFNKLSSGSLGIGEGVIASFGTGGSNIVKLLASLAYLAQDNILLMIVFGIVLALMIWLAISAQGGLVRAIAVVGGTDFSDLKEHFFKGNKSFLSLLSIVLATRVGAFFIAAVVGIPFAALLMYFLDPSVAGVLVVFAFGVPLLIMASLIAKYAICFHMLEQKKWKAAIVSALKLFRDNWLISIELAVILFVINIIAGAAIILLILIISIPFILIGMVLQNNHQDAAIAVLWAGEIAAFMALVLFGSWLATFQYASWTELFLKIRKGGHLSKIVRVLERWREKYR
ncbi:MAG: hypothetical protein AUJ34_02300 [Parcubacteria group bacterium CG1_02_41_12]|nr:MAG: hypothetical protein AUJ34_02300 [Parcubacteria group bacterium CG1_02_41_12]PIR57023.1 MAG: hypothetical protein COU72_03130 [Parcubacteria group bacterium CG10_big_fil_rev_8_21_14_0_10_41_35]PIZ81526.1 MAG: hypothetical protein COY02_01580 [Parcubacteria group bacterium CG_4_10_14_0_2_um_filter_41_6]